MSQTRRARALVWPLITVAVAIALISTAVRFSRTVAAPTAPPPSLTTPAGQAQEGVVCFGTVDLERGVAALSPLQPGRVADVPVAENDKVEQGAELLRLDDGIARSRLDEAESAVLLAQLQVVQARKGRDLHHSRVARQKATRDAMSSRIAAARRVRAHEETLAKTAVITESDRFVSDDKIREMEALERAEEERLAELEALDPEAEIRRTEYSLKAAEARRDQAQQALDECRLKAPRPGTVLRILVGPGDVLAGQPGQPAMLFAADGPQVVRATVEQEFAGRIKEGMPALVSDEADPSATWRGRVARIAGWYSQRRTVLHDPSQLSDVRTLECVIVLEAGQPRLRLGQSVRIVVGAVPK
jgi:HlyD family secretion protein